jgi:hypothetical protein
MRWLIMAKVDVTTRLAQAEVLIIGALEDSVIKAAVAMFGYPETRLNEGKALYNAALVAVAARGEAFGLQQQATADWNAKLALARSAFQDITSLSFAAFATRPDLRKALGVKAMAKGGEAFLEQAKQVFITLRANAELAAGLAAYGLDSAALAQKEALVLAADEANRVQERAKAAAQSATQHQNTALRALSLWCPPFKRVAKVALKTDLQRLEALGIRV